MNARFERGTRSYRSRRRAGTTLAYLGVSAVVALVLGTSSTPAAPTSAAVERLAAATNVSSISAGDYHSCFVADGGVKCSGVNGYGELGDGTTTIRWTPVDVVGITTATQVSGGYSHSCARLSDGTIKCWGWNPDGELGDGTQADKHAPVSVSGITTATQVAAGRYHSCAVLSDGSVRCWGDNGSGQLGDGTTTDHLTPVQVSGISTATFVSVGDGHSCARLRRSNT